MDRNYIGTCVLVTHVRCVTKLSVITNPIIPSQPLRQLAALTTAPAAIGDPLVFFGDSGRNATEVETGVDSVAVVVVETDVASVASVVVKADANVPSAWNRTDTPTVATDSSLADASVSLRPPQTLHGSLRQRRMVQAKCITLAR